ncbi:dihydrolipoyl dehydrogenase [Bacteriovorax sp. DB6_IX]|uniref:dihydrolipoyl dehydrogenase n=1 Tax=Bacteriovorax sp. DB6_IX TaxID=1353530 RepID=UPI00038A4CB8|nr:dihydrolipoyl dehydrogenase [Bacteriovorax sp. DB6_IX]EQC50867.1 dihydrolipoyl dehydrogenase [Bacteriovorax sp. DB6_IX]
MKKSISKIALLLAIFAAIFAIRHFGLTEYLTLEYLKQNQSYFTNYYTENTSLTIAIYMVIYIITTALSLPGATILTLAGGALFGLTVGLVVVSFASTIGATLAFLGSRFFLREWVQSKFGDKLKVINKGIEREGAFYLFTLRLLPIFPFFLINLVMGLTPIRTLTFYIVSQVGMLLGTIVYVNAGVELAKIDSLSGILSPSLILSFALLGVLPIVAKKIVEFIKSQKVYKRFQRPKKYDYNMISIGAGAAGLVTSYIGAAVNAKVALIEKHKMGGDCLNTGCVPSKALIKSAKVIHYSKKSQQYGIDNIDVDFKFSKVMERVQDVIAKIEPHDSIERYTKLGVDCIEGQAKILSPWEVEVNGKVLTTKNITIATGAGPFIPPIPGIQDADFLVSDNLWELRELPERFIVLGGGPIGLEMAQSFSRLGSKVTVVEMSSRIMIKEDEDVSEIITSKLEEEGIRILTSHRAKEFKNQAGKKTLICEYQGEDIELSYDKVLIAVGRKANTKGFGLEELGIEIRANGTIETNDYLQTNYPNIFACGDVAGPYQLTHTAAHQAWYCAVNGLFGKFKKFKVDYSVIPWATYTDPEVATVGKNEETCKIEEIPYEVTKYGIDDLDRAIADSEDYGFVKVLTKPGTDKIIGATIVGNHASDLLLEFISAMKHGYGLNKILGTIHTYPTMGEANKYLAGEWKKARKPEGLLKWVKKFHSWQRG